MIPRTVLGHQTSGLVAQVYMSDVAKMKLPFMLGINPRLTVLLTRNPRPRLLQTPLQSVLLVDRSEVW